jgi:hypothetical protein
MPAMSELLTRRRRSLFLRLLLLLGLLGVCWYFYHLSHKKPLRFRSSENDLLCTLPFAADAICFDQSGRLMIVHDGIIDVRDVVDAKQIAVLDKKPQRINALALDRSRRVGCCSTLEGDISRLDVGKLELSAPIAAGQSKVYTMVLGSTGGGFVAVVEYSVETEIGALKIFDLRTGRALYEKQSPLYPPLSISGDDELFAYSTAGKIHLGKFDLLKLAMEELTPLQAGAGRFSFVGSSHVLAVAQSPDAVWLWDQDSEREVDRLSVPIGPYMFTMACSDQGNLLVVGANRSLAIMQTRPLKLIHRFQIFETTGVENVAISPDAKYMAASSYDYGDNDQPGHGQVKVWRLDRLFSK